MIRRMLTEKNLIDEILEFEVNGEFHIMPVEIVIETIESSPRRIINKVESELSKIDFMNGNVLDFIEYLAKGIV